MDKYIDLVNNAKFYLDKELDMITNLSNLSAHINEHLDNVNWVGFYLYNGNELTLGPFQGKPACVSIQLGKGVCGTSALERKTLMVDDVHQFSGHITCDTVSKSEIVIPIIKNNGDLFGVLDIDSPMLSRFDEEIKIALEKVVNLLIDIL